MELAPALTHQAHSGAGLCCPAERMADVGDWGAGGRVGGLRSASSLAWCWLVVLRGVTWYRERARDGSQWAISFVTSTGTAAAPSRESEEQQLSRGTDGGQR